MKCYFLGGTSASRHSQEFECLGSRNRDAGFVIIHWVSPTYVAQRFSAYVRSWEETDVTPFTLWEVPFTSPNRSSSIPFEHAPWSSLPLNSLWSLIKLGLWGEIGFSGSERSCTGRNVYLTWFEEKVPWSSLLSSEHTQISSGVKLFLWTILIEF